MLPHNLSYVRHPVGRLAAPLASSLISTNRAVTGGKYEKDVNEQIHFFAVAMQRPAWF